MVNRPKAIGTRFESQVVAYLRAHGFPYADRQPLRGALDQGDITVDVMGSVILECKAGRAAHNASTTQVRDWLRETNIEAGNASADLGLLVVDRYRRHVAHSDTYIWGNQYAHLHGGRAFPQLDHVVRLSLSDAVDLLAAYGVAP